MPARFVRLAFLASVMGAGSNRDFTAVLAGPALLAPLWHIFFRLQTQAPFMTTLAHPISISANLLSAALSWHALSHRLCVCSKHHCSPWHVCQEQCEKLCVSFSGVPDVVVQCFLSLGDSRDLLEGFGTRLCRISRLRPEHPDNIESRPVQ
eukprot:5481506-Amphidinium_carterae.1